MPRDQDRPDDSHDNWCVSVHILGLQLNFAFAPLRPSRFSLRELASAG
jgi:hypothetical protein